MYFYSAFSPRSSLSFFPSCHSSTVFRKLARLYPKAIIPYVRISSIWQYLNEMLLHSPDESKYNLLKQLLQLSMSGIVPEHSTALRHAIAILTTHLNETMRSTAIGLLSVLKGKVADTTVFIHEEAKGTKASNLEILHATLSSPAVQRQHVILEAPKSLSDCLQSNCTKMTSPRLDMCALTHLVYHEAHHNIPLD
jgi:hypothetical protein